jgi:hypothetical protein
MRSGQVLCCEWIIINLNVRGVFCGQVCRDGRQYDVLGMWGGQVLGCERIIIKHHVRDVSGGQVCRDVWE